MLHGTTIVGRGVGVGPGDRDELARTRRSS
jgi:hypothetical protein